MNYLPALNRAVAERSAVVVAGTGVSKSASGNAPEADWLGLIRSGIEAASRVAPSQQWVDMISAQLAYAESSRETSTLISVASQIQSRLQLTGSQAYADWLRETVGSLNVQDSAVPEALASVGCPILTTNYDLLLENALSLPAVVWDDHEAVRDVLRGEPGVAHLHGMWKRPESVVLSDSDYQRIVGDEPAQHLQAAHYVTKSFVFVGYGAGLEDPNFGRLLAMHRKLFPNSRQDHFRLARTSEVRALEQEHANDSIRVIPYGESHEHLAPFLLGLSERGVARVGARDNVAFATEAIIDQLRAETILGEELGDADGLEIDQMTIAPVLLPMPHEQFVAYQKRKDGVRPRRFETHEFVRGQRVVIVAGEEGAGVTTALRWLVANYALANAGVAPLYVDARNCRSNRHALRAELSKEALAQRLIDERRSEIPAHILAVDNVKASTTSAYKSLIDDLRSSSARTVFIGARQGDENVLVDQLQGGVLAVEVVYLGKPGRSEANELARLIAPDTTEGLADQVMDVIRREHLQRTPFTICLLIVLLSRGSGTTLNSSDTAVLNRYVQLLTGRSGSFLDPRWTLDPQNREAVLSELAKHMVRERRGALLRSAVIERIETYFKAVDWPEEADATLDSFQRMRLIRFSGGQVQFQQTGYLHLFAAKAAIDDAKFLDELLEDPLYFAPIIRHFAALTRQSELVARRLLAALSEKWPTAPPSGPAYAEVTSREAPTIASSQPMNAPSSLAAPEVEEEAYDISDDSDHIPFPLDDPSTWSVIQQLLWALDLASRVVRDSDQLADLELKDSLFKTVLNRWGYLLDLVSAEGAFDEVVEQILEVVELDPDLSKDDLESLRERVRITMPAFMVLAGISTTLSSRKLFLTLKRAIAERQERSDFDGCYEDVAAAMFAIDLNEPGWAEGLPVLADSYSRTWVVSEFIYPLVRLSYRLERLSAEDVASIERFLRTYLGKRFTFTSDRHKKDWVDQRMQSISHERLQALNVRLDEGMKALDTLSED